MELMELVENEPTARPFQCDWQSCNKSSSLARHRRIHTGKRPYKCAHDGCLKSFCRKTTMVKHQRRSHQRGLHPNELMDDCTSDSDSGESPSTPKHAGMQWPPQGVMAMNHPGMHGGHAMHRAASFADFGQHMNGYPMQQQPQAQYGAHRHSLSSGGAHEFHGQPVHEQQHPGVQMLHRTASMPQHSYYVTEQNNPGVATMNTNPMQNQYGQVPRQQQPQVDMPYSAAGMNQSIQSSPSSFSAASATYALHNASPVVEHQQPGMVPYPQQMQQQIHTPQPIPTQAPAPPPQQQVPSQYASPTPQAQPEEYWNGVPYQAPVEVATIGQLPTYGSGVYDPWGGPKIEFEDPSMQLPSARIENL
ncbi:C2H2 finger domain-containing protein [Colletotrichum asianum]